MKKWKCMVCGYIHTGEEAPEECPVCGADKSKFIEVTDEVADDATAETAAQAEESSTSSADTVAGNAGKKLDSSHIYNFVGQLIREHHVHPISVHIPNGVIPISVIFAGLAVLFHLTSFEQASFYNMVFVVLAMPLVLFSGYVEWQQHYGGNRTTLFLTKIICAGVVFVTSLIIVIWWFANPTIASSTAHTRWIFLLLHIIMLTAAGIAGYLGGKLVFKD